MRLRGIIVLRTASTQAEPVLPETVLGATARALLGATVPGLTPYTGA